ncbi:hypothetical protein I5M74_01865 [Serratia marcescens]|nr:hypothetical protein [Serratia marcescens]
MTPMTERQQFEEWFNKEMVLHISASNETVVRLMWKAWQASRELLANREAQPVGKAEITKIAAELARGDYLSKLWTEAEKSRHVDTHRLQNLLDELHDVMKVKAIAITRMLTAPPAPAAPEKCPARVRFMMNMHTDDLFSDADAQEIWNACRAAMLASAPGDGNGA